MRPSVELTGHGNQLPHSAVYTGIGEPDGVGARATVTLP